MAEKGIPVLTIPSSWWGEEQQRDLKDADIRVYVHTVDDLEEACQRLEQGVSGIYSDDILPQMLPE